MLSPRTYGPDVYVKSSSSAADFPANLAAHWETLFGQFSSTHPVVIGEWGGRYGNGPSGLQDVVWQEALVDYLISRDMRSSFYWSYTPNSGDTGGILDDDLNVREDKMALLRRLWGASPTSILSPPPAVSIATPAPSVPAPASPVARAPPGASVKAATGGAGATGFEVLVALLLLLLAGRFYGRRRARGGKRGKLCMQAHRPHVKPPITCRATGGCRGGNETKVRSPGTGAVLGMWQQRCSS